MWMRDWLRLHLKSWALSATVLLSALRDLCP